MAISANSRHLLPELEQPALAAFTTRLRFPVTDPAVLQGRDAWIEGEHGVTLVFSARFNGERRFAILVIPQNIPARVLRFAGQTAASILNSRFRREARRQATEH